MNLQELFQSTEAKVVAIASSFGSWAVYQFQAFLDFIPQDLNKLWGLLGGILTLMFIVKEVREWWSRRTWKRFEEHWRAIEKERAKLRLDRDERRELETLRRQFDDQHAAPARLQE